MIEEPTLEAPVLPVCSRRLLVFDHGRNHYVASESDGLKHVDLGESNRPCGVRRSFSMDSFGL
jgi:hypothetical protein